MERVINKQQKNKSICAISDKCMGCQHIDISYEEQLAMKNKEMKKLFSEYGKIDPIIGMKNPMHYLHKVNAAFHRKKDGTIFSGIYQEKTQHILQIEHCYIQHQKANQIIASITALLKSFKIKIYNETSGFGLMRHVMVRVGYKSGQIMVVLVTKGSVFPSSNNFAKALMKIHPEISTIIQNVNEKETSMIVGNRDKVLYGKGFIEDTMCDTVFRLTPNSYFQVNPLQSEILYKKAINVAELKKNEMVLDAYCGTGIIGMLASKLALSVISVDLNRDAIKEAKNVAKKNGVENISFYENDISIFMEQLIKEEEKIDTVFIDPPRVGCSDEVLSSLLKLAPKKIVYISRGQESLAKDLNILMKKGIYKAEMIAPIDMFPFTRIIESVVMLKRK